jgi:hypothetical protein
MLLTQSTCRMSSSTFTPWCSWDELHWCGGAIFTSQNGHSKWKIISHFWSTCYVKFVTERTDYLILGEYCFFFCYFLEARRNWSERRRPHLKDLKRKTESGLPCENPDNDVIPPLWYRKFSSILFWTVSSFISLLWKQFRLRATQQNSRGSLYDASEGCFSSPLRRCQHCDPSSHLFSGHPRRFFRWLSSWEVNLNIRPLLVPRLWISGAVTLLSTMFHGVQ